MRKEVESVVEKKQVSDFLAQLKYSFSSTESTK